MLRVLLGIAIGVFIYANPEARQITADLLRATGDALAPANDCSGRRDLAAPALLSFLIGSR